MYSTIKIVKTISLIGAFVLAATTARAINPPPDGGYPDQNTAEGQDALFSIRSELHGQDNTAIGFDALFSSTNTFFNTAVGSQALFSSTSTEANTAVGYKAMFGNTTGAFNTATGQQALGGNNTGFSNTADGSGALFGNTTGEENTATGSDALVDNTTGDFNTANGSEALLRNSSGNNNTADGANALLHNKSGNDNTADGVDALRHNSTGDRNIAVGRSAGSDLTTGSNNIDIGNVGAAGESGHLRIGTIGTHTNTFIAGISGVTVAGGVGVMIDANGQLGTVTSSERYKDAIKPMEKASEAILSLKPVTFHYKKALDPKGIPQFGLVAEEVASIDPDLVARDEQGKPYTVRYEAVNAMLLNEFLKEHRKVEEQSSQIARQDCKVQKLEATVVQLQSALKEQAAQIRKVSTQLAATEPAARLVTNQ